MSFLLLLFSLTGGFADESAWDSIMSSKNVDALMRAEQQISRRERLAEFCKAEQKERKFPLHCLFQAQEWLAEHQERRQLRQRWSQLSSYCDETEPNWVGKAQIKRVLAMDSLPNSCRRKLEARLLDLSYLSEGNWSDF